jgi:hypothetical protein
VNWNEDVSTSWPGLSRPSTSSYDRFEEIVPFRIAGDDFSYLPRAGPMLDVVFSLDRRLNVVKSFKIDEAFQSMPLGKPVNESGSMFKNTAYEIVRYPDIQNAVRPIGQNVDVAASYHGPIEKDVDGRDKPGHDEGCATIRVINP